jgi:tetratricopeptide (TPR) repeat protein
MGRVLTVIFLLLAAGIAGAQERMVHSRDDLLLGTTLERFFDFDGAAPGWAGYDSIASGGLRMGAPCVGGWAGAYLEWSGGDPFAIEWETRRVGGPLEAEHALLVGYEPGFGGLRIRFAPEGRIGVERVQGDLAEPVAPWTSVVALPGTGWVRCAARVHRGRVAVLLAGEEVLSVPLPETRGGSIGFAVSPGGAFEFDHVALHGSRRTGAPRPAPASDRAIFFDSFSIGREEWSRNVFPSRDGALRVSGQEGVEIADVLAFPLPAACRVQASVRVAGTAPARFLLGAREGGGGLSGLAWEIGETGASRLLADLSGAGEPLFSSDAGPFRRGAWNRLEFRAAENGSVVLEMNGERRFESANGPPAGGSFGIAAGPGTECSIDAIAIFAPPSHAPFDTTAAAALWREIEGLTDQRAFGTKADRLRDLLLLAPTLPGVLDLLYREAARAEDGETALAAAEAMPGAGVPGSEDDKLRILALLLSRRWGEAYGELQRVRALLPDDPFGLENTLLLLDRMDDHERLIREYRAAATGAEPLRAAGHGVAAWAFLRSRMLDRTVEALRVAGRLGPGRVDVALVEGDLLRARGDLEGAAARYDSILADRLYPVSEANIRARAALVRFEQGEYAGAFAGLAAIPESPDPAARRARAILMAFSLHENGVSAGPSGRPDLERARDLASSLLSDPPVPGDALLLDLLGRIHATLALFDLEAGESYPVYREKTRLAADYVRRASWLDPSFPAPGVGDAGIPNFDPTRFRSLLYAALPDDHPVGGFVEDPSRWAAWSLADRRADLAEREIGEILGRR